MTTTHFYESDAVYVTNGTRQKVNMMRDLQSLLAGANTELQYWPCRNRGANSFTSSTSTMNRCLAFNLKHDV